MDKTVKDYVMMFNKPAYLFKNNFGGVKKWMYFIPLCDYDEVVEDSSLKQPGTFGIVKKDGKEIVRMRDLIRKPFITGDPDIFIVPLYFSEEPETKIISATN